MSTELLQLTVRCRSHVNSITTADSKSVAVLSAELLQLTVSLSQSCQQSFYSWQYVCRSHVSRFTAADSTSVQLRLGQLKASPENQKFCPLHLTKSSTSFQTQPQLIARYSQTVPSKRWPLLTYFNFMCFICPVHCDMITQHKQTRCTVFLIIIYFLNFCCLLHVSNFMLSSSGRQLYVQLRCVLQLTLMHVKHTTLHIQRSPWWWTYEVRNM